MDFAWLSLEILPFFFFLLKNNACFAFPTFPKIWCKYKVVMDPIISSSVVYCFALFLNTFEYIQNLVQVYSFWNPNVLYKGQSIPFSYFLPSLLVVVPRPGDASWRCSLKTFTAKKILSCAYHSLGSTVPLRCQSSGSWSYSDTDYRKEIQAPSGRTLQTSEAVSFVKCREPRLSLHLYDCLWQILNIHLMNGWLNERETEVRQWKHTVSNQKGLI